MPRQIDGRWISDDGKWWWDGTAWRAMAAASPSPAARSGRPFAFWLKVAAVVVVVGLVLGILGAVGWLVALVGAVFAVLAYLRGDVREWTAWKRLPGLRTARPPAMFAAIVALYLVAAPASIWTIALTGSARPANQGAVASSSTPPPPGNVSSYAALQPTSIPAATPSIAATATPTPRPTSTPTAAPPAPPPAAPPAAAPAPPPQKSCYPLTNAGNCYQPGEFCRTSDHGVIGQTADGRRIQCLYNNGWRWEPI